MAGVATVAVLLAGAPALAHDLFIRAEAWFVEPGEPLRLWLFNSTFDYSEASVSFDRVIGLSLLGPGDRTTVTAPDWTEAGDSTHFDVSLPGEGTWLVGISTAPRGIALAADDFNAYLAGDGIPDVLAARERTGALEVDARERYSKHVKARIQAGAAWSRGWDRPLGYPAEVVPLANPYALGAGASLPVRVFVDGTPVADQLVVAGGRRPDGSAMDDIKVRSDADGVVRVPLQTGTMFVKFIHVVPLDEPELDYESKWATLAFAVAAPGER